jgi:hypothetical protein
MQKGLIFSLLIIIGVISKQCNDLREENFKLHKEKLKEQKKINSLKAEIKSMYLPSWVTVQEK